MTHEEHDLLRLVYAETEGRLDKWAALTELPSAALELSRNGYLNLFQRSPDVWRVALTERPGAGLAARRQVARRR